MTAEPPPVPAPGKEAEIAEGYDKATANALAAAFTASVTKSIQELFAALPAAKQSELLAQLSEQLRNKDATLYDQTVRKMNATVPDTPHPLAASFGAFKNDPLWEDYQAQLQANKEEDRRIARQIYGEDDKDKTEPTEAGR